MYTDKWQKGAIKKYGTEVYIDYNPDKKTLQLVRADNDLPLYKGGGFYRWRYSNKATGRKL